MKEDPPTSKFEIPCSMFDLFTQRFRLFLLRVSAPLRETQPIDVNLLAFPAFAGDQTQNRCR